MQNEVYFSHIYLWSKCRFCIGYDKGGFDRLIVRQDSQRAVRKALTKPMWIYGFQNCIRGFGVLESCESARVSTCYLSVSDYRSVLESCESARVSTVRLYALFFSNLQD